MYLLQAFHFRQGAFIALSERPDGEGDNTAFLASGKDEARRVLLQYAYEDPRVETAIAMMDGDDTVALASGPTVRIDGGCVGYLCCIIDGIREMHEASGVDTRVDEDGLGHQGGMDERVVYCGGGTYFLSMPSDPATYFGVVHWYRGDHGISFVYSKRQARECVRAAPDDRGEIDPDDIALIEQSTLPEEDPRQPYVLEGLFAGMITTAIVQAEMLAGNSADEPNEPPVLS